MTTEGQPAPTDTHPEVADISALAEGLLPPSRSQAVQEHLAACELCADTHAALNEIRGLLGSLPEPEPMPADIAARLDAALAAEALVSRETSALGAAAREARNVSRETTSHVSRETSRPTGHAGGGTGPGRRRSARRWPRVLLGTGAAAVVIGFGAFFAQLVVNGGGSDSEKDAGAAEKSAPFASALTEQSLGARVQELLQNGPRGEAKDSEAGELKDDRTLQAASVPACIRDAIGRSERPVAVDQDTVRGDAVSIVVLPHPGDSQHVDAFVVASACTDDPSVTAELLLRETYLRP